MLHRRRQTKQGDGMDTRKAADSLYSRGNRLWYSLEKTYSRPILEKGNLPKPTLYGFLRNGKSETEANDRGSS